MIRADTRVVFVVAPVESPPPAVFERLRRYVEGGGNLVIVDDDQYLERGSAKAFLASFDVPITYHSANAADAMSRPHVHLGGGMETLGIPALQSFAAWKRFGKGQIVYLSDASSYSRKGLGHCFSRPWREARDHYETIFFILRDVLGIAPRERRFYGIVQ